MKASFDDFETKYGGKVFIVCSLKNKIEDEEETFKKIENEIKRLSN